MEEAQPTADQFRALGKVTHNGGRLESFLATVVWNLIGDDKVAQIITSGWSFDQLLQLAKRLLPLRHPELVGDFEFWETQARDAWKARSEFVHSWWGFDTQLEKVVRMRPKKGQALIAVSVLEDEHLYEAARKLTEAAQGLAQIGMKIQGSASEEADE